MKRTAALVLGCVAASLAVGPAHALLARVTISAARGNDADPNCGSAASPCRSLQTAHNQVSPGGEIDILDPGGYGAVTITKAVSIVNDNVGVSGSLNVAFDAITIAAGAGAVMIKGLTVNGIGTAANGVKVESAGKLVLADLHIQNFSTGILIRPTANIAFTIMDTVVTNSSTNGITVQNINGKVVKGTVLRTTSNHNGSDGLRIDNGAVGVGATQVGVESSAFQHNVGAGVIAVQGANVVARRVAASHNAIGFAVSQSATLSVNACIAIDNSTSDLVKTGAGGALTSFLNNQYGSAVNVANGTLQ